MAKVKQGPYFIRYFDPVIKALKELGGSGTPSEVVEIVAKLMNVSEEEQKETLKTGASRFVNQVHFALQYLVWEGLLASSKRGVWSLTEKGMQVGEISHAVALEIFGRQHALHMSSDKKGTQTVESKQTAATTGDDALPSEIPKYRKDVLEILKKMTPESFEHFCKRLLREYGFERVERTGGPKDKGLDGNGILKLNPFVSFRVAFQCKRYDGSVTSSEVSEFRGSIPSNADKGLLITTGYFTTDAKKRAQEPGLLPIELIDGEQLLKLMEEIGLGLKPTYEVNREFFDDFEAGKGKE